MEHDGSKTQAFRLAREYANRFPLIFAALLVLVLFAADNAWDEYQSKLERDRDVKHFTGTLNEINDGFKELSRDIQELRRDIDRRGGLE